MAKEEKKYRFRELPRNIQEKILDEEHDYIACEVFDYFNETYLPIIRKEMGYMFSVSEPDMFSIDHFWKHLGIISVEIKSDIYKFNGKPDTEEGFYQWFSEMKERVKETEFLSIFLTTLFETIQEEFDNPEEEFDYKRQYAISLIGSHIDSLSTFYFQDLVNHKYEQMQIFTEEKETENHFDSDSLGYFTIDGKLIEEENGI